MAIAVRRNSPLWFFVVTVLLMLVAGIWQRSSADQKRALHDATFDTVSVRSLRVVDEQGRPRFLIAAPLPNPVVQGKEMPRSEPVTGIQFLDPAGNETGGIAIFDKVHGAGLCFDYETAEAMCVTKAMGYKGISIFDPPGKDAQVGVTGSQRIDVSLNSGLPRIALSDSKGKERIVLAIDAKDNATMQILDAAGKPIYELPTSK